MLGDLTRIFSAKIKSKPAATVTVNFTITNARRFELIKLDNIGLS